MQRRKIVLRILFFILLMATFILIFYFSSQNGEESSGLSKGLIYNILKFFTNNTEKLEEIIIVIEPVIRKLAHFSVFTLVGIWTMSLTETFEIQKNNKISISILVGFLYACSDEIHQKFVSERSASPIDVLIDTSGVIFGIILVILIIKLLKKKNKS